MVPANVSKVFKLATKLIEDTVINAPPAKEGDAEIKRVTIAEGLKKARHEAEIAKDELAKIPKAQEEMTGIHIMVADKLRKENAEVAFAWKATAENQKTFGRERDDTASQAL